MKIIVCSATQTLFLYDNADQCLKSYPISSAKNGLGEEKGSEKTPRGYHIIYQKIGENAPLFTIFRGRVSTGEIWNSSFPHHDYVLSRILWLKGEKTPLDRYIYIHGTQDEKNMGVPLSHGCIRMRNKDVVDLFDRVSVGDSVFIKEDV